MSDANNLEFKELPAEAPPASAAAPNGKNQVPATHEDDDDQDGIVTATELRAVYSVPVQVSAVLGRATLEVNQLLKLGRGAVVELDRKVGEPIDIYVNNRLVARGEVVVVDERLGVTMTEIIKTAVK
jgi:flagellar motor switch protein FliN/FliY